MGDICRFWHWPSISIIEKIAPLCDFDLLFQGNKFQTEPLSAHSYRQILQIYLKTCLLWSYPILIVCARDLHWMFFICLLFITNKMLVKLNLNFQFILLDYILIIDQIIGMFYYCCISFSTTKIIPPCLIFFAIKVNSVHQNTLTQMFIKTITIAKEFVDIWLLIYYNAIIFTTTAIHFCTPCIINTLAHSLPKSMKN